MRELNKHIDKDYTWIELADEDGYITFKKTKKSESNSKISLYELTKEDTGTDILSEAQDAANKLQLDFLVDSFNECIKIADVKTAKAYYKVMVLNDDFTFFDVENMAMFYVVLKTSTDVNPVKTCLDPYGIHSKENYKKIRDTLKNNKVIANTNNIFYGLMEFIESKGIHLDKKYYHYIKYFQMGKKEYSGEGEPFFEGEDYLAAQEEWIKHFDLKKGDRVRVTISADSFTKGWAESWYEEMNESFGKDFKVVKFSGKSGITLDLNHVLNDDHINNPSDDHHYDFPFFCLAPLNSRRYLEYIVKELAKVSDLDEETPAQWIEQAIEIINQKVES